jgi:hypothetical protein
MTVSSSSSRETSSRSINADCGAALNVGPIECDAGGWDLEMLHGGTGRVALGLLAGVVYERRRCVCRRSARRLSSCTANSPNVSSPLYVCFGVQAADRWVCKAVPVTTCFYILRGTKEEQHNRITGTYAPWWRASFVRRQGSHDPALFPFWLWSTSYD